MPMDLGNLPYLHILPTCIHLPKATFTMQERKVVRETETETERQKDREKERQKDRETDRERET